MHKPKLGCMRRRKSDESHEDEEGSEGNQDNVIEEADEGNESKETNTHDKLIRGTKLGVIPCFSMLLQYSCFSAMK